MTSMKMIAINPFHEHSDILIKCLAKNVGKHKNAEKEPAEKPCH